MWLQIAIATLTTVVPLFAAPQSIRGIDFKNASYAWDERDPGVPSKSVRVAHALVRAVSRLVSTLACTFIPVQKKSVETSLDAARKSACATPALERLRKPTA